jgi:hypothetical protein
VVATKDLVAGTCILHKVNCCCLRKPGNSCRLKRKPIYFPTLTGLKHAGAATCNWDGASVVTTRAVPRLHGALQHSGHHNDVPCVSCSSLVQPALLPSQRPGPPGDWRVRAVWYAGRVLCARQLVS